MSNKIDDIVLAVTAVGDEVANTVFDKINRLFKASAKPGSESPIFNFYSLSRRAYHFALALGEEKAKGQSASTKPHYTKMVEQYETFKIRYDKLSHSLCIVSDDDIQRFCKLESRRQGSGTPRFYTSIALFIIYSEEKLGAEPLVEVATPSSEQKLVDQIHRGMCGLFNDAAARAGLDIPLPDVRPPSIRKNPRITVPFDCEKNNLQKLDKFVENHLSNVDGYAHFYVYRARKRYSLELMKSFLAITPYELTGINAGQKIYQFVHAYIQPNDVGTKQRLSMGRVVPLGNGICLIGGQRADARNIRSKSTTRKSYSSEPFRSLSIIYLPWADIEREPDVMHGMALLPNDGNELLASRTALIATGHDHSLTAALGAIMLGDLEAGLEEDMKREPKSEIYPLANDEIDLRRIALSISDYCNNEPIGTEGWNIPEKFRVAQPADGAPKSDGFLTRTIIESEIAALFGSGSSAKYVADDGETFDFWSSIRFGPLWNDN